MKNFILMIVLLITGLTMNSLKAQGSWNLKTISGVSGAGAIQFLNANEGWMSVNQGGLIHTTDGGLNWNPVSLNTTDVTFSISEMRNVSFISLTTGWVLKTFGAEGNSQGTVVYKTTNGGTTWERKVISQNTGDFGYEIQFVDADNGWLAFFNLITGNPTYLKTIDGGNTWIPTSGQGIFYYTTNDTGYSFTAGFSQTPPFTIYKTVNAGANWTPQFSDSTDGHLQSIYFSDINNGWVVGLAGKIYKTTNGGTAWTKVINAPINSNIECTSVYFLNATTGWIGCTDTSQPSSNYFILHTIDGGANWTTQSTSITSNQYWVVSIFFLDENNGWFASDNNEIAKFTNALGTKENIINKYITIYPNPNNGTFYFSLKNTNSKVKAEIYTLSGQKVFEASNFETQPQNEVHFAPQSKGVYFIKINDGENSYTEKILIQ